MLERQILKYAELGAEWAPRPDDDSDLLVFINAEIREARKLKPVE